MRIIAGIARGTLLVAPRGSDVRPTSDRVREAVFSSLGDRVVGATVLDLFAGTGALGLEAASRGAQSVVFVEKAQTALRILQQNLAATRRSREISCEFAVVRGDVFSQLTKFAATQRRFSLIFADPPYGDIAQTLADCPDLQSVLGGGGLFVLESAKRNALAIAAPLQLVREAIYGDTRVSVLTPK